jgi:hypothetical protein
MRLKVINIHDMVLYGMLECCSSVGYCNGALVSLLSHGVSDEAGKSEWYVAQLDDVLVGTGRRRERRYGM